MLCSFCIHARVKNNLVHSPSSLPEQPRKKKFATRTEVFENQAAYMDGMRTHKKNAGSRLCSYRSCSEHSPSIFINFSGGYAATQCLLRRRFNPWRDPKLLVANVATDGCIQFHLPVDAATPGTGRLYKASRLLIWGRERPVRQQRRRGYGPLLMVQATAGVPAVAAFVWT